MTEKKGYAKKRLLVLSLSDLSRDARVQRHLRYLSGEYEVVACGYNASGLPGVRTLTLPHPRQVRGRTFWRAVRLGLFLTRAYGWADSLWPTFRQALRVCGEEHYDAVWANDVDTLPVAYRLAQKWGAPILLDAHEYAPREFEDRFLWRVFYQGYKTYLCRKFLPGIRLMTTVSPGIARAYREAFGLAFPIHVLLNAPPYQDLPVRPASPDGRIRLVHHGGAIPSRKLEGMIQALRFLDHRFTLDFYLVDTHPEYLELLKRLAAGDPRITFHPPAPPSDLVRTLNGYDVGVYLLPPTSLNSALALPNKLFEFIQARLAVAIGPSPEMSKVVAEWGIGVVADGFEPEAFARALRELTPERVNEMKGRSYVAAKELCADRQYARLLPLIEEVLEGHAPTRL